QDVLDDSVHVGHDVVVGDPDDAEAAGGEDVVAEAILVLVMGVSVDFDDQPRLRAEEVGDETADHRLAAEFVGGKLTVGEVTPEAFLGLGGVAAHFGGAAVELGELFYGQAPPQTPPLKGRGFSAPALVFVRSDHPTLPSRLMPRSFCASTANSIGSCCSTSLAKPLTMRATLSSRLRPRLIA